MNHKEYGEESEVKYPSMRHELQYAVRALSDEGFQERMWGDHGDPDPGVTYTFDMALHALLDDSIVADNAREAVGLVLKGGEVDSVMTLVAVARRIIQEIGLRGDFTDARERPSWNSVVEAAKRTRSILGDPPRFP